MLVAVEVVEQVPGGGQGQLAGTDGAHLVVGKGVHVELVHHGVELDQFLQLSLENGTCNRIQQKKTMTVITW